MCRDVDGYLSRDRVHGFTLVELLTVLGIIVVILAVAIPVFDSMTGNHSTAAAQNTIASTLATARADAIYNRQITGVFFFLDPATGRFAMAEVQADPQSTGGYTFTPTNSGAPNGYGDSIYGATPPPNNGLLTALEMVNTYTPSSSAVAGAAGTFSYYRDVVELPAGIGVALNNNYYGYNYTNYPADYGFDRYVRTGVILFDSTGSLITIPYAVQAMRATPYPGTYGKYYNQLALRIGLTTVGPASANLPGNQKDLASVVPAAITGPPQAPAGAPPVYPLISQVGLILYNHDAYLNQKTTNTSTPGDAFTDTDLNYLLPWQGSPPAPAVSAWDKNDEENWLDSNSTAILVSPVNGSLVTAQ
jgi:prepilin-type N-terminal cleavage/methylation domain-containing protein